MLKTLKVIPILSLILNRDDRFGRLKFNKSWEIEQLKFIKMQHPDPKHLILVRELSSGFSNLLILPLIISSFLEISTRAFYHFKQILSPRTRNEKSPKAHTHPDMAYLLEDLRKYFYMSLASNRSIAWSGSPTQTKFYFGGSHDFFQPELKGKFEFAAAPRLSNRSCP